MFILNKIIESMPFKYLENENHSLFKIICNKRLLNITKKTFHQYNKKGRIIKIRN